MLITESLTKTYTRGGRSVDALRDLSLRIEPGEFIAVKGPSGSGKTTLLLMLGGMLRPTSGRVLLDEADLYAQSPQARSHTRRESIGFIFQMFHLLPYLTLEENIRMADSQGRQERRIGSLIEQFGLAGRAHHLPRELSAGERQRTAIARALVNQPKLILADEPTGNLDPENTQEVINCLSAYRDEGGMVVMVTHGDDADDRANRIIRLRDGVLAETETAAC